MAEREGDDPLLHERRELVRHPRSAALARAQHLEPVALDPAPPDVVGGAVDVEHPAGFRHRRARRVVEQLQAVAE